MSVAGRVLVAGVGNVFLGDDGFGVEVARRLLDVPLGDGVEVADFGVRGVHLAYRLLEGYERVILIDAMSRRGAAGTVYLLEPELDERPALGVGDPHGIDLGSLFGMVRLLGGQPSRVVIVGCEPGDVSERMGLSPPVERAVEPAVEMVKRVLRGEERKP